MRKPVHLPKWLMVYAVGAVAAMFIAAGCSGYNDARGKGDAPAGKGDDSTATITNMPDGFPNVSRKCLKGSEPWAAAVNTSGALVLYQDPVKCGGKPVPGATFVSSNIQRVESEG